MFKHWLVMREVAGSRLAGSQHKFTTLATKIHVCNGLVTASGAVLGLPGRGPARQRFVGLSSCVGNMVDNLWRQSMGSRRASLLERKGESV